MLQLFRWNLQSCNLVITSVQKHPTFTDSHAVAEGPEIVSTAPDLEELTVN